MDKIKQIYKLGLETEFKDYLQNKLRDLFDYKPFNIIGINEKIFKYDEGYFIEYYIEDGYIQLMPDSYEQLLSIIDKSAYSDIVYDNCYDKDEFDISLLDSYDASKYFKVGQIFAECEDFIIRNYQTKFKLEFNPVKESRKIKLNKIFTE